MTPKIIAALLRDRATDLRHIAAQIAQEGFLPHTESSNNIEAKLRAIAQQLHALQEDVLAPENDPPEKGEPTHAR